MNQWQVLRQLRYLLLSRSWTGSSNKVFGTGSVVVSAGLIRNVKKTMRMPLALIYPTEGQSDPDHGEEPDLLSQSFTVTIATVIPGDAVGEKPIIGGNVPDRTKSEGRGIVEVEEELFAAIAKLTTDTGVVISFQGAGAARPTVDEDFGYIVQRDYLFKGWLTANRFYHPCINLVATGGSGQVSLSWTNPPDRYDRFKVVLRRASGGTVPATVTSGTGVTLSGNLAASVTDSGLSAGTYSYSLFAQYDETYDAIGETLQSADRTSSAVSRQSVTVT